MAASRSTTTPTVVLGVSALEESGLRQTDALLPDTVPALTKQTQAQVPGLFAALPGPTPTEPMP